MPPSLPHVAGVEHREVVVRGLRLHVALAGPAARPAGGAPARLAPALVRVAAPDRAAGRGRLSGRGARLPRLRLVGVPAGRGLPQGDPGRRPDRAVRGARARAHLATSATTGAAGSAGCCACAGRTWSTAPCCCRRRRRSRPTGSSRPALGRLGRLAYQLPIAAPMPNAAKLRLLAAAWARVLGGRPPDEVERVRRDAQPAGAGAGEHAAVPAVPAARGADRCSRAATPASA